ncbi:MAG: hypothetical protein HUJ72_05760 [Blautia sp.]|nr:hypothetical protein [Blautia sp.]
MDGKRLLWAATTKDVAKEATKYTYCRIGSYVTMVYGKPKKDSLFEVANDDFLSQLSDEDKAWLANAITESARHSVKSQLAQIQANDRKFMEDFEKELQIEKERFKRETKGALSNE